MRIWCLSLCLSLISGLFHVSAMPLDNPATQMSVTLNADSHNACHEALDTSHQKSCHITGHLCCLGFSALQSQTTQIALGFDQMMNPVFQTLILQVYPNKQFKPPKQLIQI